MVLGMTEVDASSHLIENPDALHKLQEREEKREKAARERDERRKRAKQQQVITRLSSFPSAFSGRAAERTVQAPQRASRAPARRCRARDVNDSEDEAEQDQVDLVHIEENGNDDLESVLSRIQFERKMSRLFSQSRKNQSKMTLFFILPDRKKETLHRLIAENVIPGSTIYTDEWKGYCGLDDIGFVHKTICHKRRFSRFEFEGNMAIRVTTNHIERIWVELRRTLKYTSMDDFRKYIWLETYSQMNLFNLRHFQNFDRMMNDFSKYAKYNLEA